MNQQEYQALEDEYLTHEARVLYVMCLRRYMDFSTGLVGTSKRIICFQQFFELLSVSRPRGSTLKSFRPTKQNVRGYIKELIRVGLIEAMPKENKRDNMVFRCLLATTDNQHPDLFRSDEEQHRSNIRQQPLEQPLESLKEHALEQPNQSQKTQGFQRQAQHNEQPLEQLKEQPLEPHRSNIEEQHTSVTSVNTHSLLSRANKSDDVQAFDQRFAPSPNGESISSRKFPMGNHWKPDESFTDQAQAQGLDLSQLDNDQGEQMQHALEEFRTYWQEEKPGYTTTQRMWQSKFIQSLKRASFTQGNSYGQRHPANQPSRSGSSVTRPYTAEDFDLDATW